MTSINIFLNNEKKTLVNTPNLAALAAEISSDNRPFAIAINGQFIPKSRYQSTSLQDLDKVEILHPMQGG